MASVIRLTQVRLPGLINAPRNLRAQVVGMGLWLTIGAFIAVIAGYLNT